MPLEPPALSVFAEHMRDGTWLDIRAIGTGNYERVRCEAIIIRLESEAIEVVQEWIAKEGIASARYRIECEDVIWCKPSVFEVEDVTRWKAHRHHVDTSQELTEQDQWWEIAKQAVLAVEGIDLNELEDRLNSKSDHMLWGKKLQTRYMTILVMVEISDETHMKTCNRCGYVSITPLLCARDYFRHRKLPDTDQDERRKRFKDAIDKAVGLGAVVKPRPGSLLP